MSLKINAIEGTLGNCATPKKRTMPASPTTGAAHVLRIPADRAARLRRRVAPAARRMMGVALLHYRNRKTGAVALLAVLIPCPPTLLRALEKAFAKNGFVRVEDAAS